MTGWGADSLGSELGGKLRQARRRANLTMQQLAEVSGVSQPHLSQLENGKVSPSINTLYKLADALGVSPQALLPAASRSMQVVPAGSVPPTPIADIPDAALARLLVGAPDRMLQVQEVTVGPDDNLGGFFTHGGEEFIYVVTGAITVEVGDEPPAVLKAGDAAWYESTVAHRWSLDGVDPAVLIVVSAVPRGAPHVATPTDPTP